MWTDTKPANIALIKYMGKTNTELNLPCNPSLSYTLKGHYTRVTISPHLGIRDTWASLTPGFTLTKAAQTRFLTHFAWLKTQCGLSGRFLVQSGNNFPSDCGLASSASSFAALTACTIKVAQNLAPNFLAKSTTEMARLSQQGSGSSCRSFFDGWVLWDKHRLEPIDLPFKNLQHHVIVIDASQKAVSSSQAHQRVITSPHFAGRPERAQARLAALITALQHKNWSEAFQITWEEFQDMHQLFRTSIPAFDYQHPNTLKALDYLQDYWNNNQTGPLVTMDAGANIHLLFQENQTAQFNDIKNALHEFTFI